MPCSCFKKFSLSPGHRVKARDSLAISSALDNKKAFRRDLQIDLQNHYKALYAPYIRAAEMTKKANRRSEPAARPAFEEVGKMMKKRAAYSTMFRQQGTGEWLTGL